MLFEVAELEEADDVEREEAVVDAELIIVALVEMGVVTIVVAELGEFDRVLEDSSEEDCG